MTLADYFEEMQVASNAAEAQYLALTEEADPLLAELSFSPPDGWDSDVAAAGEQLLSALTDETLFTQQAVDVDLMIFEGLQDMLTRILTRIEAIEVPELAVDPHSEMVTAAAGWDEVVTDITNVLSRVASAQELAELVAPLDLENRFDAIHVRFTSACLALQAVADLDDATTFDFNGPWLGSQSSEDATAAFACGEG